MRLPPLPTSGRSLGRQARDRTEELSERALAPEDLDARLFQPGQVCGAEDRLAAGVVDGREPRRSLGQLLQVCVVHGHPSCAAGGRRDGSSAAPARAARELVEGDGAGHTGVETLDRAAGGHAQRDRHQPPDVRERAAREAGALGAHHQDRRPPQVGRVQLLTAVGGEPVHRRQRQLVDHVGQRKVGEHRQAEERAHGGADGLRPIRVGGAGRGDQRGGAERDRRPEQRADVAGVLDAVHVHDEQAGLGPARGGRVALAPQGRRLGARRRPEQRCRGPARGQRQHRDDVGGRLQRGDTRRDAFGHGEDRCRIEAEALAEFVGGLLAQEDGLRPPAGRQRSRDHVGAFRQEGTFAVAELTLAQRRRPLDEGVLRAGQWCAENPKRLASLDQAVRPLRGPRAPGRRARQSKSDRSRPDRRGSCGRARSRRAAGRA